MYSLLQFGLPLSYHSVFLPFLGGLDTHGIKKDEFYNGFMSFGNCVIIEGHTGHVSRTAKSRSLNRRLGYAFLAFLKLRRSMTSTSLPPSESNDLALSSDFKLSFWFLDEGSMP